MDSIHQAKVKSGHLLHKIALVQSQRNSTVHGFTVSFWKPPTSLSLKADDQDRDKTL